MTARGDRLVAEHNARVDRVLSVPCPKCQADPGQRCRSPRGGQLVSQHGARWDEFYRRQQS